MARAVLHNDRARRLIIFFFFGAFTLKFINSAMKLYKIKYKINIYSLIMHRLMKLVVIPRMLQDALHGIRPATYLHHTMNVEKYIFNL